MFPFDFLKKIKEKAYHQGYNKGFVDRMEQSHNDFAKSRLFEESQFLDAPVIIIPNEWENPIVGFGVRLEHIGVSPIIMVMNYISMEVVCCGGVKMPYNRQRLDACLSLEPYDLCSILYGRYGHEEFRKAKTGVRSSNEEILSKLEQNGFFEKANTFLTNKR